MEQTPPNQDQKPRTRGNDSIASLSRGISHTMRHINLLNNDYLHSHSFVWTIIQ